MTDALIFRTLGIEFLHRAYPAKSCARPAEIFNFR